MSDAKADDRLTVSDLGEKKIIEQIISPLCSEGSTLRPGIGDDAAILSIPTGKDIVVSCDKIPEDLLALQLGLMTPYEHGRYLATVNISDIAAAGGRPIALLSTLALPSDFSVTYLEEFVQGFVAGGKEHRAVVVGGDTGWSRALCLSATAIGYVDRGRALSRHGAAVGDDVFVTGFVGSFNTALLYYIVAKPRGFILPDAIEEYLRTRLVRPQARVHAGMLLAESAICTSCMDITDGVGRSMFELASASGVVFEIEAALLPIHESTYLVASFLNMPVEHVLFGIGLDLELLGTLKKDAIKNFEELQKVLRLIGRVAHGENNRLKRADGSIIAIPSEGWQHFAGRALDVVRASVPVP